jgi:hypothetical protein
VAGGEEEAAGEGGVGGGFQFFELHVGAEARKWRGI